jgi:hypothetical protein
MRSKIGSEDNLSVSTGAETIGGHPKTPGATGFSLNRPSGQIRRNRTEATAAHGMVPFATAERFPPLANPGIPAHREHQHSGINTPSGQLSRLPGLDPPPGATPTKGPPGWRMPSRECIRPTPRGWEGRLAPGRCEPAGGWLLPRAAVDRGPDLAWPWPRKCAGADGVQLLRLDRSRRPARAGDMPATASAGSTCADRATSAKATPPPGQCLPAGDRLPGQASAAPAGEPHAVARPWRCSTATTLPSWLSTSPVALVIR